MSAVDTSLLAIIELRNSNGIAPQELKILDYLSIHRSATRRVIARDLKMETSTVSARINGLKAKHKVIDKEVVKCPISNKYVHLVAVAV